jgi:integrase
MPRASRHVSAPCDAVFTAIADSVTREYLHRWLDHQRARGIRSRTLDGYEGYIRREILPVIGGLELAKVRSGHIRAVLARVQQRGLSAATLAQVRSVLGSALRQAVADGLITANAVAAVKRPRVQRRELRWPTSAQLRALVEASGGTMWEIPILLAAVTGARRAEVLGISWEGADLKTGTIFIRRGVQPVRSSDGRTVEFTPLKTKRSRRIVQLPPFALERIRLHRREQLKRRRPRPEMARSLRRARPIDRPGVRARRRVLRLPGLLHQRVQAPRSPGGDAPRHPLARTCARPWPPSSVAKGFSPVIVSAALGHASPSFTIAMYQHPWQEGPSEAAQALEAALGPLGRWQSVGTRGPGTINGPSAGDEHAGQEGWGV